MRSTAYHAKAMNVQMHCAWGKTLGEALIAAGEYLNAVESVAPERLEYHVSVEKPDADYNSYTVNIFTAMD